MEGNLKKALICTALAGFIRSFLKNDIVLLQEMGYEVHCAANIHHNGADGMRKFFSEQNVIFHQVDFSSNKPFSWDTIYSYKQIKHLVNSVHFSFVHVHTPIAGALVRQACRRQRRKGLLLAYTTHGFYFHKGSGRKSWMIFHTIESFYSRFTDAMITINHEDFENAEKMHCSKVYYIPGVGVDVERFKRVTIDRDDYRKILGIKEDAFVILAVGELSQRKNHRIIIEALGELKESKNIIFIICGNAMTAENTKNQLEQLAKEKSVDLRLLGLRKDVPEICKCSDIGVMPSLREGLGLSGIEMLASGLPVIGANVHGIVDYIKDGVNGYLCDPTDSRAFAIAIQDLLDDTNRLNMSKACSDSALPFDIHKSNEKMREIYKDLLGKKL